MKRLLWLGIIASLVAGCELRSTPPDSAEAASVGTGSTSSSGQTPPLISPASNSPAGDIAATASAAKPPQAGASSEVPARNFVSLFDRNPKIKTWLDSPQPPVDGLALRDEMTSITACLAESLPNLPDVLELHARSLALVGNLEQAKEVWGKILEIDPGYGYALQGIGNAAKLDGKLDAARDYLEKALNTQSDNAKLTHELAETLTLLGDIQRSTELLENYTQRHPNSTETFVLLGQGLLALKEYNRAKQAFERALELHPDLPRAQQGLGTTLVRLGDRERAKELLEAQKDAREKQDTTPLEPAEKLKLEMRDSAELYYQAARLLSQLGYASDARSLVRRATVHNPHNLMPWRLWMELADGGIPNVFDICTAMVEQNQQDPSARYELGTLQMVIGRLPDALASMQAVVDLSPNDPAGYEGLVRVHLALGRNVDEAIVAAKRLVELSPTGKSYDLLAQALAVSGNLELARETIQQALALEPNNPQYQFAAQKLDELLEQRP